MSHYGTVPGSHHFHLDSLCLRHKPRTDGCMWCGLHTQIHAADSEMDAWDALNNPIKTRVYNILCNAHYCSNLIKHAAYTTHLFIWAIRTIQITITAPSGRDAQIVWAVELWIWSTWSVWTVFFIRVVPAVIIPVTLPALLNALSISTSELIWATRFIWPCTENTNKSCYVY